MKKLLFVLLFIFLITLTCYAISAQQEYFAQSVLKFAYETEKTTGLPASIIAAQCILESGWGRYTPTDWKTGERSNNFFGIRSDGIQPYISAWEYEWEDGKYYKVLAKFRKYKTFVESLIDYGNFILNNPRYRKAIEVKDNPRKFIYELWKAGYATDPHYVRKVLDIAEQCKFIPKEKE